MDDVSFTPGSFDRLHRERFAALVQVVLQNLVLVYHMSWVLKEFVRVSRLPGRHSRHAGCFHQRTWGPSYSRAPRKFLRVTVQLGLGEQRRNELVRGPPGHEEESAKVGDIGE